MYHVVPQYNLQGVIAEGTVCITFRTRKTTGTARNPALPQNCKAVYIQVLHKLYDDKGKTCFYS